MNSPIRVLFLCEGNADRSQMAEGLMKRYGAGVFEAHSAGLEPRAIHPLAIAVMQEVGIDISGHESTHLDDYLDTQFDYVITLCDKVKSNCIAFPRDRHTLHWQCDDPSAVAGTDEARLNAFRQARETISNTLMPWMSAITHQDKK